MVRAVCIEKHLVSHQPMRISLDNRSQERFIHVSNGALSITYHHEMRERVPTKAANELVMRLNSIDASYFSIYVPIHVASETLGTRV